ncbi:agmatinase [Limibacillus halophilus]|uniref:Agmatinase n=1 Tax=Limibacillus halophilus TaxID=1579333 RepID=A0A839SR63_9PROT|nr:agmatinase [Limibacillus halophilus]MBB3065291.1 agmatinase [Limibacillus halophilus]
MSDDQAGDQAFRNDNPHNRWSEMTYGGALSFLRRRYSRDLTGVDVAVTGVPYDCAVTYRPGARLGPRAIRAASVQLAELKAFPFGFDPFKTLNVVDYGDCFLNPHDPLSIIEAITAHISEILAHGAFPLTFGGDHFITYPVLRAIARAHGPVALVHFDAHCDTWPDDGQEINHGTMFLRAKNEGLLDVEGSVQVGLRTYNDDSHGFEILSAPWVHREGSAATIEAIRERVGARKAYLTFDIDCLDPAFAPGTGTPVSGGLTPAQALEILRSLGNIDFVGMDVVEVAPAYDLSEVTAINAATLAHDFLCLLAEKKGAKRLPIGRL